ncbi:DCC1-like thiol-disulfide oxidoreductase family protein [Marinilongibacter aquaticus]|uniref:thiol-disulfide oxidoreductase DCC family protein n=1 Tax=Marinilongibacter aquaticus TaxID=2975157 RepID=UPI0021BD977A|nr:DCC1-like thiol-disulfide oxidoreductase family protein [Marinilongibacter aquaticus]UBM60854.1 DCC1-like thiol-disulfide oxidoreductase family protein [Marinilongibacter aquaticus]
MHLILFDGVCNLCNGFVQFIIKKDRLQLFEFAALQSEFAHTLLSEQGVPKPNQQSEAFDTVYYFDGEKLFDRSDAILKICELLPGYAWLGRLGKMCPKTFRDTLYKFVSSKRYALFGKRDSCMLPTPEIMSRFRS